MSKIRSEVLNAFKKLHRARQSVFQGDERALAEGRKQINENFRKNQNVTDEVQIKQMVQLAHDVEKELRTNIIQAVQTEDEMFHLRITEETTRLDNVMFNPDVVIQSPRRKAGAKSDSGCCGGSPTCDTINQKLKN